MKVKAKKQIPMWGSYQGLDPKDWVELNAGKTVEISMIPDKAKEYLEIIKSKQNKKGDD